MTKKIICLTGAHLTPSLALINLLKKNHWSIIYFGRANQVEKSILQPYHIKPVKIITNKLKRHNLFISLLSLIKFPLGLLQSIYFLNQYQPRVVVSFGGFVALPVCLAAKLLKIPLIIHEQTLAAGLTSKLTGWLAARIAVSWPQSLNYFPSGKTFLTGNPIRPEIIQTKNQPNLNAFKTIYITGGSQGSLTINRVLHPIILRLLKKYQVIHQFGLNQSDKHWQQQLQLQAGLPKNLQARYQLQPWFSSSQVAKILATSDLVIGRAGINTITELAYLSKPAILIPLSHTQKNEQLTNARWLQNLGLAIILPQTQLTQASILKAISAAFASLPAKPKFKLDLSLITNASLNLYRLIDSVSHDQKT